jgi:CRP-like cAMP-binding protein
MDDTSQIYEDQALLLVRRLEEAGVPVARRNYFAGELLYTSGDADGYLCFLLEGQVPRNVRSRLASLLLALVDRFGEEARPGVAIGLRFTHQRLAEMVACTREAVSKEMACLEREGYIETRNRERKIVLLDRAGLGELAG